MSTSIGEVWFATQIPPPLAMFSLKQGEYNEKPETNLSKFQEKFFYLPVLVGLYEEKLCPFKMSANQSDHTKHWSQILVAYFINKHHIISYLLWKVTTADTALPRIRKDTRVHAESNCFLRLWWQEHTHKKRNYLCVMITNAYIYAGQG